MPDRSNIVYVCDGSFEGVLCCVFESFQSKEIPAAVITLGEYNPTLYPEKHIETDMTKFNRVKRGIITKISIDAYELVVNTYYSCAREKELLICDFVRIGFANGKKVLDFWTNDTVNAVLKAAKHLGREAHQYLGFVRFSIHNGTLVSVIEPKNFVLPGIAPHFCDRYANEIFMIYDKTHSAALIHRPGESKIIPVTEFTEPPASEEEVYFRKMWKLFYDTIGIEERENPRCRMGHMQKRYWSRLTEMQGEEYFTPAISNYPEPEKLNESRQKQADSAK